MAVRAASTRLADAPISRLRLRSAQPRGRATTRSSVSPSEKPEGDLLRATLAAVAPGTALRDGLERILRGNTGALVVLAHAKNVETLCPGGFPLDVEFSATRLRELAKMDGAIVLDDSY